MRQMVSLIFIIAFSWWFVAESYVGMGPTLWSAIQSIAYVSVAGLLVGSLWQFFRGATTSWWLPAFAVFAVVSAQLVWRDFVHQLPDFKLYADYLFEAFPLIVVLGLVAVVLEWQYAIRKAPPAT